MPRASRMISRAVPLAVLVVAAVAVTTGAAGSKPALADDVIPEVTPPTLVPIPELPAPPAPVTDLLAPLAPATELPADPGSVTHQPSPAGPGSAGMPATDVCATLTDPAASAGAPVAAQCAVRETEEGGVDVPLCADVATIASCDDTEPARTPTTSTAVATNAPAATPVPVTTSTKAVVARTTPATVAVEAANTSSSERESSLPLTGVAAALVLAVIGASSLATGTVLQRLAPR